MPRCLGTNKKDGAQCRITWDLDANGYCKFHLYQRLKTVSPSSFCKGTKRDGSPCKISWDLDPDSQLCVYHISQRSGSVPVAEASTDQSVAVPRKNAQRGADQSRTRPREQEEEEDGREDDDDDAAVAQTSGESNDEGDEEDDANDDEAHDGESKSRADHTPPRMALYFEKVTHIGRVGRDNADAKLRWKIEDTKGNFVVKGTSSPGVAKLLSTVPVDGDMKRLQLVVAIDIKKKESITSEPHNMSTLSPSATIKISKSRRVKVHLVRVESAVA